jgi:hypothetical protein
MLAACVLQLQVAELQRADQLLNRLSRVAAAINLRTSDPLTESGHDPVVELRHYYGSVAGDLTQDWQVWFESPIQTLRVEPTGTTLNPMWQLASSRAEALASL